MPSLVRTGSIKFLLFPSGGAGLLDQRRKELPVSGIRGTAVDRQGLSRSYGPAWQCWRPLYSASIAGFYIRLGKSANLTLKHYSHLRKGQRSWVVAGQHRAQPSVFKALESLPSSLSTLLSPTGVMLKLRWGPGFTLDAASAS